MVAFVDLFVQVLEKIRTVLLDVFTLGLPVSPLSFFLVPTSTFLVPSSCQIPSRSVTVLSPQLPLRTAKSVRYYETHGIQSILMKA